MLERGVVAGLVGRAGDTVALLDPLLPLVIGLAVPDTSSGQMMPLPE